MNISDGTLRYINNSDTKLLTSKEEQALATIINGKAAVKNYNAKKERIFTKEQCLAIYTMVEANRKLVIKEAFIFATRTNMSAEDFIGAGNIGLTTAAHRFEPNRNRFSTYALFWIREGMQDLVYRQMSDVAIPVYIANGVARRKKIIAEHGKISEKEMMKQLKVTSSVLKNIMSVNTSTISLNQVVNRPNEENGTTYGDIMEDEKAIMPSESAARSEEYELLRAALGNLDERSKDIVMAQCLDDSKTKLGALGKKYDLTGERVRQIRQMALESLRKTLSKKMNFVRK